MTALRIIGKQRLLTGMRDKNYTDAALMIKKRYPKSCTRMVFQMTKYV